MLQEGFAHGEAFLFFCPVSFTMCPQAKKGSVMKKFLNEFKEFINRGNVMDYRRRRRRHHFGSRRSWH